MHPDQHTPEAAHLRDLRSARKRLPSDPLKKRQQTANRWKEWHKTEPLYGLVHSRAFYRHPGFSRYLMPGVRSHIEAKRRAHRQRHADEMRASAQRAAHAKALAKAEPMPLFEGTAA